MKTAIYALRENHFVRYVGKTVVPLEQRLANHLREARRGLHTHKCRWIRQMLSKGLAPTITILSKVEGNGCKEEIAWIKYFRDYGIELTNISPGGTGFGGGPLHPFFGKHLSEEHRRKVGLAGRGRKMSKEAIEKIRLANIGRHPSDSTLRKLRESHLGYRWTDAAREKLSKSITGHVGYWRGRKHSEQHKKRISDGLKSHYGRGG